MILCDQELEAALKSGGIVFSPEPPPEAVSTSSIDLHLGVEFKTWKRLAAGADTTIDTQHPDFDFNQFSKDYTVEVPTNAGKFIDLQPKQLVLGVTKETVHLVRYAGRVEGKSSLARIGLGVHITAPTIHYGFKGVITLELVNHGLYPIRLHVGQPICQLIIEQVYGTPKKAMTGAFQNQTTVHGSPRRPSSPPSA